MIAPGSSPADPVYTTPVLFAIRPRMGPTVTSASTLSITTCLPLWMVSKATREPTSGMPVASTTTSTDSERATSRASSVTLGRPGRPLVPSTGSCPTLRTASSALSMCISAAATTSIPVILLTFAMNPRPICPMPTIPTRIGVPSRFRASSLSLSPTVRTSLPGGPYLYLDTGLDTFAYTLRSRLFQADLARQLDFFCAVELKRRVADLQHVLPGAPSDGRYPELSIVYDHYVSGLRRLLPPFFVLVQNGHLRQLWRGSILEQNQRLGLLQKLLDLRTHLRDLRQIDRTHGT